MGLKFRILKPTDPYYSLWVKNRIRTRIGCFLWIGFMPAIFLSGFLFWFLFGWAWPIGAIPGIVIHMAIYCYVIFWPCPRCGRPFNLTLWRGYWSDNCLHCGLPKYAPNGDY